MANYPPLFLDADGNSQSLRTADGGLEINVIDCDAAGAAVNLYATLDGTGTLTMFSTWTGTAGVGAATSVFAFAGGITVAETCDVTGAATFADDMDLGTNTANTLTMNGSVDSDITFDNAAPRKITIDSQTLQIEVSTAGLLNLLGASEIQLDTILLDVNATGAVELDAVTASHLIVSGAAADLTLGARATTITLNDVTNTSLHTLFTATSLMGALNELKSSNAGNSTPSYAASEVIAEGDVVYVDWDVGNGRVGLYLADNHTAGKQNPVGVALNAGGIGTTIYVATQGQEAVVNTLIVANTEGAPMYLNTTGTLTAVKPTAIGDSCQIIGIASKAGAAGTARIIVQMRDVKIN